MLAEIPVVASNFPLWEQIISDSDCGVCVNPKKPEEIGKAINTILTDDTRAQQMGKNGRKAVLEKYNWSIEKEKLKSIYLNLMSK